MDRDPTRYAEAATCSLNISRNCHDPDGSLRLVPDSRDVLAGLQRLCDVKDREWNAPALICHSDARNLILLDATELEASFKRFIVCLVYVSGCVRLPSNVLLYAWSMCLAV